MRRSVPAGPALAIVLAAVALATPAARAQDVEPVRVDARSDLAVSTTHAAIVEFEFALFNVNARTSFYVTVEARELDAWRADAIAESVREEAAGGFFLGPREATNVTVTLTPIARPPDRASGALLFVLVNTDTSQRVVIEKAVDVAVKDAALVIGLIENPFPPPLDNAYGVFALDLAFWAVVGVAAFLAGDSVVRYVTRFATADVTRVILQKLRWPLFTFVLLLGLKQSIDVLPRNALTVFTGRFLAVIAVGVVGLYVLYRALDAGLFYYSSHIAPKTASRVDDVLVPALRKIVVVVLFVGAIGYTLGVFGLDPTVLFGAAGIAGLVIAFAAQDTLSNFFSGIFLLLDRPFAEGEDIQWGTGETARVERVGLRSTRLYHYRSHEIIVMPNNQLASNRIVNLSAPDARYRLNIEVGVAYDTDLGKVKRLVDRVLAETPGVDLQDAPQLLLTEFGDSALVLSVRVFVKDYRDRVPLASEIRERLLDAFRREGIDIPFPQRVLHVVSDEPRSPVAGAAAAPV